ncbi:hypothetical protein AB6A40_009231 [Gnathostoma spinigerum]|uniref:Large ribosomal subunit protein mL49 n=1 Tax=Gnathostoma spinigerum TaxID=75299 RepID=A0ABD6F0E3_9BILA
MLSLVSKFPRQRLRFPLFSSISSLSDVPELWEDPWKYARPQKSKTFATFEEAAVDWKYVERLMPVRVIPDVPKHDKYPTPSGWRPPNPPPDLSYYIGRNRKHLPALYLESRRDNLNPETMNFDYVELVVVKNIHGDVFACERDMRRYLEEKLGHPIATNVDELKGQIKVKGADRSLIENFIFDSGF